MSREASGALSQEVIDSIASVIAFKWEDAFDLRSAFLPILNVSGMPDGDEDDDDDDGSGGDDDGGSGDDGDDGSSGDGDTNKGDIKDPDKKKLSDEAAKHRNAAKAEKQRADAAEKRLRELEDKDKSELEKAQRDAKEATARAEKAEAALAKQAHRIAFYEGGAAALFKNPATALRLLADDLKDIEPDDDGVVDPKAVKEAADALLKAEPYLGKGDDDGGSNKGDGQPSGRQTNGKSKTGDLEKEKLASKFPALRAR